MFIDELNIIVLKSYSSSNVNINTHGREKNEPKILASLLFYFYRFRLQHNMPIQCISKAILLLVRGKNFIHFVEAFCGVMQVFRHMCFSKLNRAEACMKQQLISNWYSFCVVWRYTAHVFTKMRLCCQTLESYVIVADLRSMYSY